MSIRVIDAGRVSGVRSQTIYHGLAKTFTKGSPDTIVLVTPEDPYFSIGFFQDVDHELDVAYCRDNNIPIVRRETGGGAVYLDQNQLFIQWIFHRESLPVKIGERYRHFIQPILDTYRRIGIQAAYHPVNDIHVRDRKIAGLGSAQIGEAQVVTGNFILDFDFHTMLKAMNIQDPMLKQNTMRDMKAYLTTIKQELDFVPPVADLKIMYLQQCRKWLQKRLFLDRFSEHEYKIFEELDVKMTRDKWLFLNQSQLNHKMIKIHAGVWLGMVPIEGESFEFEIKFGKLTYLYSKARSEAIHAFKDMDLSPEGIQNRLQRVYEKEAFLKGESASYWENILMEINALKSKYA